MSHLKFGQIQLTKWQYYVRISKNIPIMEQNNLKLPLIAIGCLSLSAMGGICALGGTLLKINELKEEKAALGELQKLRNEKQQLETYLAQRYTPCDSGQTAVIQKARTAAIQVLSANDLKSTPSSQEDALSSTLEAMHVFCGTHWKTDETIQATSLRDATKENPGEVTLNYLSIEAMGLGMASIRQFNLRTENSIPEPDYDAFVVCRFAGTLAHEAEHVITPEAKEPKKEDHDKLKNDWIYKVGEEVEILCRRAALKP